MLCTSPHLSVPSCHPCGNPCRVMGLFPPSHTDTALCPRPSFPKPSPWAGITTPSMWPVHGTDVLTSWPEGRPAFNVRRGSQEAAPPPQVYQQHGRTFPSASPVTTQLFLNSASQSAGTKPPVSISLTTNWSISRFMAVQVCSFVDHLFINCPVCYLLLPNF